MNILNKLKILKKVESQNKTKNQKLTKTTNLNANALRNDKITTVKENDEKQSLTVTEDVKFMENKLKLQGTNPEDKHEEDLVGVAQSEHSLESELEDEIVNAECKNMSRTSVEIADQVKDIDDVHDGLSTRGIRNFSLFYNK